MKVARCAIALYNTAMRASRLVPFVPLLAACQTMSPPEVRMAAVPHTDRPTERGYSP